MSRVLVLVLAALTACATVPANPAVGQEYAMVTVPHGAAPVLDGRLGEGEWAGAAVIVLGDSSELRLLHDGVYLYAALRATNERIGSVCVAAGAVVRVLHASMALGDAAWQRSGEGWNRSTDFAWGMRETDQSDTTRARRAAFLTERGWLATTAPMSRPQHVLEFQLALAGADPTALRLGFAHLAMSGQGAVIGWPETLADDCGSAALVGGTAPDRAAFQPDRWAALRLLSPGAARSP